MPKGFRGFRVRARTGSGLGFSTHLGFRVQAAKVWRLFKVFFVFCVARCGFSDLDVLPVRVARGFFGV